MLVVTASALASAARPTPCGAVLAYFHRRWEPGLRGDIRLGNFSPVFAKAILSCRVHFSYLGFEMSSLEQRCTCHRKVACSHCHDGSQSKSPDVPTGKAARPGPKAQSASRS